MFPPLFSVSRGSVVGDPFREAKPSHRTEWGRLETSAGIGTVRLYSGWVHKTSYSVRRSDTAEPLQKRQRVFCARQVSRCSKDPCPGCQDEDEITMFEVNLLEDVSVHYAVCLNGTQATLLSQTRVAESTKAVNSLFM